MLPVGSDELLILSVQSEWQDYVSLAIPQLPYLDSVISDEQEGVSVLLDSSRLSDLIVVVELRCADDRTLEVLG